MFTKRTVKRKKSNEFFKFPREALWKTVIVVEFWFSQFDDESLGVLFSNAISKPMNALGV